MPKLTDIQIKDWIKSEKRFEGCSDGNGRYLCFPKNYAIPFWHFRYRFVGKAASRWPQAESDRPG